jgi:hypothetical protein
MSRDIYISYSRKDQEFVTSADWNRASLEDKAGAFLPVGAVEQLLLLL